MTPSNLIRWLTLLYLTPFSGLGLSLMKYPYKGGKPMTPSNLVPLPWGLGIPLKTHLIHRLLATFLTR